MRQRVPGILLGVILACTVQANANITGWLCDDDHDGVILMDNASVEFTDKGSGDYDFRFPCTQAEFATGNVVGDFTVVGDPSVYLIEDVYNDTGFAWTGYDFYIGMPQSFTISENPAFIWAPDGWSAQVYQPTLGTMPNGGSGYVGSVIFRGGPAIADHDTATFGLKIIFNGSIHYCTGQTPVPEPVSATLLGMGALTLARRRR
jgi:hypothetical protein